jgi:transcriptional regulator with XRE-family HTH domain
MNLLKSKMALHGDKLKELADVLNISVSAVSLKMSGVNNFNRTDIEKIIDHYNLTPDETNDIFFK